MFSAGGGVIFLEAFEEALGVGGGHSLHGKEAGFDEKPQHEEGEIP